MDKYLPVLSEQILMVQDQIGECQRILYRNDLENLVFTAGNEKAKIKEVEYNKQTLKEKLDLLFTELERLNATSGNNAVEGNAVQPDPGGTPKGT